MGQTKKALNLLFLVVLWFASPGSFQAAPALELPSWQAKVDPWVLQQVGAPPYHPGSAGGIRPGEQPDGKAEFLVFLSEQADLSSAKRLASKEAKGEYVYKTLSQLASSSQGPLLVELAKLGIEHRPYWVANMIWVRGDLRVVKAVAERAEVAHLYANPWVAGPDPQTQMLPIPQENAVSEAHVSAVWNILKVGAPLVWEAGYTGQGAVIGGQDTGYEWTHPALVKQYRGWNGVYASHDYNWHDAIHAPATGNPCGYDSPEPCDDSSHGTHTMGTMVGDDGLGNQVGMAPGASWIGCRNMDRGFGTPATYSECFEWFISPYPVGGTPAQGNPAKAPHIINNSWGCPPDEGCTDPTVLQTVVDNTRAAGILVVVSAGNYGPTCSSVHNPPAIYDSAFSVGATDSEDMIPYFSSRGPVIADGSGRLKPDVTAPGVSIYSSILGGRYGYSSGTSMAAPHATGLAALLISAQPSLAGDVSGIEHLIKGSSLPIKTTESCGGFGQDAVPNNTFGWGRIDAWKAFQLLHRLEVSKSGPTTVEPGETFTYTLRLENLNSGLPAHNLVLVDTIPEGAAFVSATEPYTKQGGTVRWDFPDLAAGEVTERELVVRAPDEEGTFITNSEFAAWSQESPDPVMGTPVTSYVGYRPDPELSPGSLQTAFPGSQVIYTHTLTNTGNIAGTFYLSHSSGRDWPVFYTDEYFLEPGKTAEISVAVHVPAGEPHGLEMITVIYAETKLEPNATASAANTTRVVWRRFYLPLVLR